MIWQETRGICCGSSTRSLCLQGDFKRKVCYFRHVTFQSYFQFQPPTTNNVPEVRPEAVQSCMDMCEDCVLCQ